MAIEHKDVINAINKYEWENPIMAGDMLITAFVISALLTFGYILIDVMQSEKNFAEIIDIINESLVISGNEKGSNSLYLHQEIDQNFASMDKNQKVKMGFNIKESSKMQKFYWKKDKGGTYEVPPRLKKYTGT